MTIEDNLPDLPDLPHHGDQNARSIASDTRLMTIACVNCARSKTKCNHRQPCSRCQAKGLTCVSRQSRRGKARKLRKNNPVLAPTPIPADQESLHRADLNPTYATHVDLTRHPENQSMITSSHREAYSYRHGAITDPVYPLPAQQPLESAFSGLPRSSPFRETQSLDGHQLSTGLPAVAQVEDSATSCAVDFAQLAQPFSGAGMNKYSGTTDEVNAQRNPGTTEPPSTNDLNSDSWHSDSNFRGVNLGTSDNFAALSPALSALEIEGWGGNLVLEPSPGRTPSSAANGHSGRGQFGAVRNASPRDNIPSGLTESGSSCGDEEEATWAVEWEHWTICQCNPLPQCAARDRQKLVLANLERNFLRPGPWSELDEHWRQTHFMPTETFSNVPLSDPSREWLLVIMQRYMRVAIDVQGLTPGSSWPDSCAVGNTSQLGGYIRLPPAKALHNYLEVLLRNYEPFYPLLPARVLEPNHLASTAFGRESTLLLCLMIAFGSMIDPALKARRFSTALTEICRHSMHDALERALRGPTSRLLYYCALLFIIRGAFSGDKAHMNISIAHRRLYHTAMQHAGLFQGQQSGNPCTPLLDENLELVWKSWVERESAYRLAYGWVLAEHEISLLYGIQPMINISDVEAPLPAHDHLWLCSNADEWRLALCQGDATTNWRDVLRAHPNYSLRKLFQLMINDQLEEVNYQPDLLQLRLLLYPIHMMVSQLAQLLDYGLECRQLSTPITQTSSMRRSGEIQCCLKQWIALYQPIVGQGARFHALSNATLVLYHLVSLDLYASFMRIERFAREGYSNVADTIPKELIRSSEDALIHCGQVFRLFGNLEDEIRPVWSAAAIYRATLTLWFLSISRMPRQRNQVISGHTTNEEFAFNRIAFSHPLVKDYLRYGQGEPYLINKGGERVSLTEPRAILMFGVGEIIHGPMTTNFSIGVKQKLEIMIEKWSCTH
ncbi:Zn(II)2Cys6 transcription factor [Aspergillus puulaauensis]|uniref:Zn(2)-C6 fungal-type domain-containing protein n=1 Tax=Aspergillus puulaauensis TaxID=1220207 RepID=A0A7R7XZP6_9EURO|nr:uncharacterized protein APUU_80983A [Aspergillus puulaauensis]BCS30680.1 hypothetical protein APUU_80983A [Aspergillus puulaauensis]